jgi:hypothetical protein
MVHWRASNPAILLPSARGPVEAGRDNALAVRAVRCRPDKVIVPQRRIQKAAGKGFPSMYRVVSAGSENASAISAEHCVKNSVFVSHCRHK